MSGRQRGWWPAMPGGGQYQTSDIHQQDPRMSEYWKCIQQDLSRAMPWALPEHIQAQRTSPSSGMATNSWSPQQPHAAYQRDDLSSERFKRAPAKQKAEHTCLLNGTCNNSVAPCTSDQAAQSCTPSEPAPAPTHSRIAPEAQPHVLYAALFLSSEQQRLLLDRQATTFLFGVCLPHVCLLCSQYQMRVAKVL